MTAADPEDPPRLVLLGGPGGVGTSGATATLADRLAGSGERVAVADLDPHHGATARLTHSAPDVLRPAVGEAIGSVGALLDRLGLDPRLAGELAVLPGAETVEIVHRLAGARTRRDLDVILVDLGSRVIDVVAVADRLPWLASHLLRAQRGWLSSTRPRTATRLGRWPGADGHAAAGRFAGHARSWAEAIRAVDVVLVGEQSDERFRRLRLGLALHELPAPEAVRPAVVAEWSTLPGPAEGEAATLVERADGWTWRLALPGLRSQELRVDRSGDDLALEVLGVRRLVTLPSAMRRFRTAGARVSAGHLEIEFVPEESRT